MTTAEGMVGKQTHPRVEEVRPLAPGEVHGVPLFVHQPVVETAEQNQILQLRLAAVGPVLHVVGVRESKPTARESAATVPGLQSPPEQGRNRPCLAPDVVHPAIVHFAARGFWPLCIGIPACSRTSAPAYSPKLSMAGQHRT